MNNKDSNVVGIQVNKLVRYATNPFILTVPTKAKRQFYEDKSRSMTIHQETEDGGRNIEVTQFASHYKVDTQTFFKVFDEGMAQLLELNKPGKEVYRHLAEEMRKHMNQDKIYMSHSLVADVGRKISQVTYSRGIKELVDRNFIAPVLNQINLWWINPNFVFNGDRLKITASYERDESQDNQTSPEMENKHANQA
jgi:hypothetical protein